MIPARRASFSKITSTHLTAFSQMLSDGGKMITDSETLVGYNKDWLNQRKGNAPCALLPNSTAEVRSILRFCNENKIAVVPQGGNTGLVYGGVPVHDEVILSMKRMKKLEIHPETESATCDAGVVLHDLHEAAKKHHMIAPLDLGARGSCCIGGNIATNAGGIHFARYGSMFANTLGLRVVLANGEELDMMGSLKKDNTGFPLQKLFIGSEGCLGVITQAELKLHPLSDSVRVAVARCPSFDQVLKLRELAMKHLAEILAAFEVMDAEGLAATGSESWFSEEDKLKGDSTHFAVLIETRGANEEHDMAKMLEMLEAATEAGVALDVKISNNNAQNAELWRVREDLPVKLAQLGPIYKFDLTSPGLSTFCDSANFTRELLKQRIPDVVARGDILVNSFGHAGDSNVHLNIVLKKAAAERDPALPDQIRSFLIDAVYDHARRNNFSISAEHGIGAKLTGTLAQVKPKPVLALMRTVKDAMDPFGILNPYKVLASE